MNAEAGKKTVQEIGNGPIFIQHDVSSEEEWKKSYLGKPYLNGAQTQKAIENFKMAEGKFQELGGI